MEIPVNGQYRRAMKHVQRGRLTLALATASALITAFGVLAGAQTKNAGTLTCSTNVTAAPELRTEGYAEQAGDITITCTGGQPTPKGQPLPTLDILTRFNLPVTNPTVSPNSGWTEAILLIDEPKPSEQKAAPVTALSGLSFTGTLLGTGTGYNFQSKGPNVFQGRAAGAQAVEWTGIPIDSPDTVGGGRILRITNVRAKAADSHGNSRSPASLIARVFISYNHFPAVHVADRDGQHVATELAPTTVGIIQNRFLLNFASGSAPANQPFNAGLLGASPVVPASPSATLRFSALFPGVVKAPASGFQDVPGQVYNTDAGFTSPAIPAGFKNFGTEFQAVFNDIPAGVSVFVGTTAMNAIGEIQLTSSGTAAGSTGLTELPVTHGSATAIWETTSADPTQTGTFAIPVYFAFQSGVAAPSNITVVQSLGSPPGGAQFVQPPALLLQPILFSINTGASTTPMLTGTVDSRPCILGPVFFSDNACTPNNGLFVNISSDSASATVNSPTFTSEGNVSEFALMGSSTTPIQVQVFAKAPNATPGTYPQTMTVTSPTGANSLNLPFTVAVLPADNPIVELTGFFDAFSYQSDSIAPGQLYTLFGNNFGPPSLVYGALDKSGKFPTTVANTQVLFDGVASPLIYVDKGQLSGEAPFELTGKVSTNVQVISNGVTSPAVTVPVQAASISIASADGSGGNGGVIFNKDGTLNTTSNPTSVGDTVVIWVAYAGPFANGVTGTDGRTTTAPPYPAPEGPVSVKFGGIPATNIQYFANAPTLLEPVMQINVTIPKGVKPDLHIPVVVSAGSATSAPWTTIAVK